ncbi:MAG TPA: NTF2 fold immunity protein [Planctomycetota bacterium]|nr:NTF2 fold immunity protein [Planctomycetota bacterium]
MSLPALAFMGAWAPATDGDVKHSLAVFAETPLGSEGEAALATIVDFAEASAKVEIVVSEEFVPWIGAQEDVPHSELLLGAWVAGNVRSQLDSGVTRSDAYAGMLQMFAVYGALKATEPKFKVPAIEGFLDRHRRGELIGWLAPAAGTGPAVVVAQPSGDAPAHGLVPDADTAIRIAVAIWDPIYGADAIAAEKPWVAKLDGEVWNVTGSLPAGRAGGVAEASIDRTDGRILHVGHGEQGRREVRAPPPARTWPR